MVRIADSGVFKGAYGELVPKKICNYPGCSATQYEPRCPKHSKAEYYSPKTPRIQANRGFYNSARWDRLRKAKLARDPLCEIRYHCKGDPADSVDHIQPIEAGGEQMDIANLQSACRRCHTWKTVTIDMEKVRLWRKQHDREDDARQGGSD